MATAKKLKSGNWRVLAYVGKDVTKSGYKSFTAPTKKEAERMAASFVPPDPVDEKENLTVGQAIDNYISIKNAVLSPSTIRSYKIIRKTMLQSIMDVTIFDITESAIQSAINEDSAKGKSPKTIRNAHGLLRAAVSLERDFNIKATFPQKQKPNIKIPSKSEIDMLAEKADPDLSSMIQIAAILGLRRSEVCALEWSDYNEEEKTLSINKACVRTADNSWIIKSPKSYAGFRVLPVPHVLQPFFENKNQGRVYSITPDDISNRFRLLQERCFGSAKYRFHDLRHYNASIMLALGVPNKYAQERLGHATDNMLKAVYQHTMKEKQEEISSQLNDFFSKNTTQNTTQK